MSAYPCVVTSPATWTRPVVTIVSTATRLAGSSRSRASRTASLIWSQILSGWPSVTDSEVKSRYVTALLSQRLLTDPSGGAGVSVGRSLYRRVPRRVSGLPQLGHHVPDPVGDLLLCALGHRMGAAAGVEDGDGVARLPEHPSAGDVVDHQQVAALAGELGPGVGEDVARVVAGLGGEADDDLPRRPGRDELGEHVGVPLELELRHVPRFVGLLDLRLRG